jgi:hypothetical protein
MSRIEQPKEVVGHKRNGPFSIERRTAHGITNKLILL